MIKKVCIALAIIVGIFVLFLYLVISAFFAIIQGNGAVTDNTPQQAGPFIEFQQFSYKTINGDTWYEFAHPYQFPTLGVLIQGVILDPTDTGKKHIAWDIADPVYRETEVKAFADGKVVAVDDNILYGTTRKWSFCDESNDGICWTDGNPPADIQIGCGYEIVIEHADGLSTDYCHLEYRPILKVGDSVVMGQLVGYQGSTGWAKEKNLYFALLRGGQPIAPSYAFTQTRLSNWGQ